MTTKRIVKPMQEIDVKEIDIMVENCNNECEGVTMMPLKNISGDINYVIMVQEDTMQANNNIQDDGIQIYECDKNENLNIDTNNIKADATDKKANTKHFRGHFECSFCSYIATRRYLLLRHVKSHSEVRQHKCDVCGRGFKTASSLQNHINMHYGVKPHLCKYCNTSYTTSGELIRHIRYKHTHEKPHKCNECDYASVELSKLRRHLRCHTGENPYQCPHCTYASADTFKLKRHLRTHTGEKPYKCEHCNMKFTQSNSLKSHKQIHNATERPVFACDVCPTKCGRMTDLRIHIQKLHTSADQPFKCKICDEMFPDRYTWKIHHKTHKGEKCYKCKICSFAGCSMARLKTHMLKHMDIKPFACKQCEQRFRQKQLLRRHENLYHKPGYVRPPLKEKTHSCHEYGRAFAYPGNLSRHLSFHEPKPAPSEQVVISDRIKEVQCISGQPKVKPELSIIEPMYIDDQKHNKKITLYDTDTKSYFLIEVINYDNSESMIAFPNEFIEGNILNEFIKGEEQEVEDTEDVKNNPITNVDTCFGFDV